MDGRSSTQTAIITVVPTNDASIALDQAAAGAEDAPITAALALSDIDFDDLSFALVAGGAPINGAFTYTPDVDFNGDDEFTDQVNNGAGGQDVATVSLTITAVNDAPTAPAALAAGEEDGVISGRLQASNPEGDAVTFRHAPCGGPTNGSFDLMAAGAFTFVPAANFNGVDQATIIVADPIGAETTQTLASDVVPGNDQPVA